MEPASEGWELEISEVVHGQRIDKWRDDEGFLIAASTFERGGEQIERLVVSVSRFEPLDVLLKRAVHFLGEQRANYPLRSSNIGRKIKHSELVIECARVEMVQT